MPKKEATKAIAFRISADKERRLNQLAAASQMTPGEYAREALFEKLDAAATADRSLNQLIERVGNLEKGQASFREDFATAVETILIVAANSKALTPDQIKKWVNLRLRRQTGDAVVS